MSRIGGIGGALVSGRQVLGLTQRELAGLLGVKQQQIARWECTAYRSATLERIEAVARVLGLDVAAGTADMPIAAEERAMYEAPVPGLDPESAAPLRRVGVSPAAIAAFARSHGIERLELFGSILTADFRPLSDVDVLVTYDDGRGPSLLGAADHETELAAMMRRRVDLVSRPAVERSRNPVRRAAILDTARTIYAR